MSNDQMNTLNKDDSDYICMFNNSPSVGEEFGLGKGYSFDFHLCENDDFDVDLFIDKSNQNPTALNIKNQFKIEENFINKKTIKNGKNKESSNLSKAELIKLRNRENSRNTRKRKKLAIQYMQLENKKLKSELSLIKSKLQRSLCDICKKKLMINDSSTSSISTNTENDSMISKKDSVNISINDKKKKSSTSLNKLKKPFTLFVTLGAFICVFYNILNSNGTKNLVIKYGKNIHRRLYEKQDYFYKEIAKKEFSIGDAFVSLGDYYSITRDKPFLYKSDDSEYFVNFNKLRNVRILREVEVNENEYKNCKNCVVFLNKKDIKFEKKGYKFKILLRPNNLIQDGYTILEVDCEIIGLARDRIKYDFSKLNKLS